MSKTRVLVRRLKSKDFKTEFFCAGGKGGQHQNKVATACRIRHPESGAVAECRSHRNQLQNRKEALLKLKDDPKFVLWARMEVAKSLGIPTPEERVEEMMKTLSDFRIEVKDKKGRWKEVPWDSVIPDVHVAVLEDGSVQIEEAS